MPVVRTAQKGNRAGWITSACCGRSDDRGETRRGAIHKTQSASLTQPEPHTSLASHRHLLPLVAVLCIAIVKVRSEYHTDSASSSVVSPPLLVSAHFSLTLFIHGTDCCLFLCRMLLTVQETTAPPTGRGRRPAAERTAATPKSAYRECYWLTRIEKRCTVCVPRCQLEKNTNSH